MDASNRNIDGKDIKVKDMIFTMSNCVSFLRVPISFLVIYLHWITGQTVTPFIIGLILFTAFTDMIDGWLARKLDQVTELGKTMDPVADKLSAFLLFLYTVYLGWIPLTFFIFGIFRDILIMIGSLIIKIKRNKVAMSIMSGKISVNVLALYWIAVFFSNGQSHFSHQLLMWLSVILMTYSFFDYVVRFRKIYQGADFN